MTGRQTSPEPPSDMLFPAIQESDAFIKGEDAGEPLLSALARMTADITWRRGGDGLDATSVGHAEFTGCAVMPTDSRSWLSLVHPADRTVAEQARMWTDGNDGVQVATYRLAHRGGGYRWVEERAFAVKTMQRDVTHWVGAIIDVDARVCLETGLRESEERLRLATSAGKIGIWDVDLATGARRWSKDLKQILGLSPEVAESESLLMSLVHPDDRIIVRQAHRASFIGVESLVFRIRRADDGQQRWIESIGRAILDESGRPVRRLGTWQDVTSRKESEALLQKAASQDTLTELSNREVFNAALSRLTTLSRTMPTRFAVVLIDIDQFKMINDTLGHEVGDVVLKRSAERLRAVSGDAAVVARLGGDEFAVLLTELGSLADLSRWAEQAVAALSVPIWFEQTEIVVSASLGAAAYPDQNKKAAELLKCADLALYASKRNGRARFSLFEPAMKAVVEKRAIALQRAREALIGNDIVPYYQPKVSPHADRAVDGFEALLRWRDNGTIKPPSALAEALEDPDLAIQIGRRILSLVVDDIRCWTASGLDFGSIAVNVTGFEFSHGHFADEWLATIAQAGIAPERLQVEVTETVFLGERSGEVGRALDQLSRANIKTALDDFGTGHASLTHLRAYPVDVLKIDKSFVDDIEGDAGSRAIIRGLIALAHELDIRVVAEGVETRAQQAVLTQMGCDFVQGYLVAKPMAGSRVPHFLNAWTDGRPLVRSSLAPQAKRGLLRRA